MHVLKDTHREFKLQINYLIVFVNTCDKKLKISLT
jgi:hypothetical protein